MVEHCVSSAKVVGSIPREHTYWQYKCIAWMHCKSLWIKVSAKCKCMYMTVRVIVLNIIFFCPARDACWRYNHVVAFYNEAPLLQLNSTKCRMIILRPLAPPRLFPSVCLSVSVSSCLALSTISGRQVDAPVHYLCEITGFILFLLPSFISRRLLRFC